MKTFKKVIMAASAAAILAVSACSGNSAVVKEVSAELKGTSLDNFGYGLARFKTEDSSKISERFDDNFPQKTSSVLGIYELGALRRSVNTELYSVITGDDAKKYEDFQTEVMSYYFDTVGHWANDETILFSDGTCSWCCVISDLTNKPVIAVMTDDSFITGELATIILMNATEASIDGISINSFLEYYNEQLQKEGYATISWKEATA